MDLERLEFSSKYDKGEVKKAALIMGAEKVHDLTDSYVDYLRSKGKVETRDPLVVSYKTGTRGKKQVEKRYDYIMHSPKWRVVKCAYPYDESVATNSDHSAVIADFELTWLAGQLKEASMEIVGIVVRTTIVIVGSYMIDRPR